METQVPQTLQQAVLYFHDPNNCLEFIKALRWPNGRNLPEVWLPALHLHQESSAFHLPPVREEFQPQGRHDLRKKPNPTRQVALDHVAAWRF